MKNNVQKLYKTLDLVHEILEEIPYTRNNDSILYLKIVEKLNPDALNLPFWQVLSGMKDYNLPNFETVRRSRQMIQENYPHLAADKDAEGRRKEWQDAFLEFAICGAKHHG